jgi:uroporphyrinogen decarboxylase
MSKETMTPRERWLAVLNRKKPDRIPMDYWATPEAEARIMKHLGVSDPWEMFRTLHIDRPVTVEPAYIGPALKKGFDWFGVGYTGVSYGKGEYDEPTFHPLAQYQTIEEIEQNYSWPAPDWFDYTVLPGKLAGKEEYPAEGPFSEPFYLYKYLRGMEQSFIDLASDPELVHYILGKLFDYEYTRILRTVETIPGRLTYNLVGEDFGTQTGLMYSPAHIREFFFPRMQKLMELLHQSGVFVMTHSDGGVREAIPGLIEIGMDILNPVQWRCVGMGREGLKRDFGDRIVFHGAMDNQETLPFGRAQDVRREVAENISILGAGGGYILAPCHNLQSISPPENIVAMYETGYREGFLG